MLKLFSPYTFAQRKAASLVQIIPDAEIESYPKFGFVAPLDGALIKGSTAQTVYIVDGGLKHPISGPVFVEKKLSLRML